MTKLKLIIILISSIVWLTTCVLQREKIKTIQKLHRTGAAIAVDDLVQKYEREHQKFCEEEIKDGDYLKWPAMEGINLYHYCRKYLQKSVPGRTTDGITGMKMEYILHYEKVNANTSSKIVIVKCKIRYKSHINTYYMTKAPQPNCVYALKSTGRHEFILTIINKYCDFEDKPLINRPPKRKRGGSKSGKIHYKTRQPIAKDEYLLRYELELQELLKGERNNEKCIKWLRAVLHPNLDSYCYQYLGECVPQRNRENVTGTWKIQKLHYQKLKTDEEIMVTTITCSSNDASKLHYHTTRAPETNCVYALIREGRNPHAPLAIIFKHCDFENTYDQQTTLKNYDVHKSVIPKTEVKGETFDTLKTLQLLPKD